LSKNSPKPNLSTQKIASNLDHLLTNQEKNKILQGGAARLLLASVYPNPGLKELCSMDQTNASSVKKA
jgi:hypothetical protein